MSIKIENTEVFGWRMAILGCRNPMNSREKSDSDFWCDDEGMSCHRGSAYIGPNDHKLLMNLCKGGTEESKWRRMIHVQMDVTAPLYWWKEFETYKVGTVSNSCSTMHKIHAKEFTIEDFSCEHLGHEQCEEDIINGTWDNIIARTGFGGETGHITYPLDILKMTIVCLNAEREKFLETKDKKYWWQMIQLLPSSYNQKRTIDLNYEVLAAQYQQRKDHKLDEWHQYCDWIKTLPYSEFITMKHGVRTFTLEDIKDFRPSYENFRKSVMDGIIPVNKEVSDWMNRMDAIIEEADKITMEEKKEDR